MPYKHVHPRRTDEQKAIARARLRDDARRDAAALGGVSNFDLHNATRREVLTYAAALRAELLRKWRSEALTARAAT
jgi:hypothetical protein